MGRLTSVSTVFAAIVAATACLPSDALAQTLVWQEEFDGPVINGENWIYDVGTGCQLGICGWGNSELQYYTSRPENARTENGHLIIEARRESFLGSPFTSARLKSEGRLHFKYGTLEARIRIPEVGNGLWPAYWMLGAIGNWPARGEIDMMEAGSAAAISNGVANRRIGGAVHWDYQGNYAGYSTHYDSPVDLHTDFHVYRLTWDPEFIRVSIDGTQYFEVAIGDVGTSSMHEFHEPHFLLLNLAVAGTYTGIFDANGVTAPLPAQMQVDYIRLYQDHPDSELYLGPAERIPPGRYGVFTERTDLVGALDFGNENTHLYLWNNLTPIPATPYEGTEVMAYRADAGQWFGLGIITAHKNMSAYAGGYLKFHMRTTTTAPFRVGISTSFGNSWIDFAQGGEQYGLVRDGNWHEVSIPFNVFHDLDLHSAQQMFMLVADPPAQDVEIFVDNVYYLADRIFIDGFQP